MPVVGTEVPSTNGTDGDLLDDDALPRNHLAPAIEPLPDHPLRHSYALCERILSELFSVEVFVERHRNRLAELVSSVNSNAR